MSQDANLPVLYPGAATALARTYALAAAIALYRAMEMTFWLLQAEAALAQIGGADVGRPGRWSMFHAV